MPNRITLSKNPSLQDSVRAAHEALETGGSVRVGRRGHLKVTGGTFFGRAVRNLKIRFFPDKVCQQNHIVIAALNEQVNKEFGTDDRLKIKATVTSAASHKRFLKSIINSVSDIRAGTNYTPATSTEGEVGNALRLGFAGNITAQKSRQGQTVSSTGESQTAREQLFWYNRTMNDLHNRFPKLRHVPAISTLDLDKFIPKHKEYKLVYARYRIDTFSMEIFPSEIDHISRNVAIDVNAGFLTPKQDCSGIIHHEYAHHLSNRIVPGKRWVPKLVEALKAGGMTSARISYVGNTPMFDQETAGKIASSVCTYAAKDALECAAEILSWYMNPEYGKSVPAMPYYLENWVTECFPMLDTG